jgi:hypothetical protein
MHKTLFKVYIVPLQRSRFPDAHAGKPQQADNELFPPADRRHILMMHPTWKTIPKAGTNMERAMLILPWTLGLNIKDSLKFIHGEKAPLL